MSSHDLTPTTLAVLTHLADQADAAIETVNRWRIDDGSADAKRVIEAIREAIHVIGKMRTELVVEHRVQARRAAR